MDETTTKEQSYSDFFTKYIAQLIIILYEYVILFFVVIFNLFSTIFTALYKALLTIIGTSIYKLLKILYEKIWMPIYKGLVWPLFRFAFPFLAGIWDNFKGFFQETFGWLLENNMYMYVSGFMIYLFSIIYYNSDAAPVTGAVGMSEKKAAPGSGWLGYINPLNWAYYTGKFFFIFLFAAIFLITTIFKTIKSGEFAHPIRNIGNPDMKTRIDIGFYVILLIGYILSMVYLIKGRKFIYLILLLLLVGLLFIRDTVFKSIFDMFSIIKILLWQFITNPSKPFFGNESEIDSLFKASGLGDITDSATKFFTPAFSTASAIAAFFSDHFMRIWFTDTAEFTFLITSSILFILYLAYAYFNPRNQNTYYLAFTLYVLFMAPMFYKMRGGADMTKTVLLFLGGIISIIMLYIGNDAMSKSKNYDPTPEQQSNKNIYNILFLVYSAILVLFVNIRLLSPQYKESSSFLYIIVHAVFILALLCYSVSYTMKLRNRISKTGVGVDSSTPAGENVVSPGMSDAPAAKGTYSLP
jgi:hypothetical protein